MKHINTNTGRTVSMPKGLLIGVVISMGITTLGSCIIAYLLDRERMTWGMAGYGILVMLIISSFLGARIAWVKIRRQKLLVSIWSGLLYFTLLLSITALFFGGQYDAVGVTLALIAAGCSSAGLLGKHENRGGDLKRRRKDVVKLYK